MTEIMGSEVGNGRTDKETVKRRASVAEVIINDAPIPTLKYLLL